MIENLDFGLDFLLPEKVMWLLSRNADFKLFVRGYIVIRLGEVSFFCFLIFFGVVGAAPF